MFRLVRAERERPGRYQAVLVVDGVEIGIVERGWSQVGPRANDYVALVDGITVASGQTLPDLRNELNDWILEERQLEEDAVWRRKRREAVR